MIVTSWKLVFGINVSILDITAEHQHSNVARALASIQQARNESLRTMSR